MTPLKILLKLIYKLLVGGAIIFLFNAIATYFEFQVALNMISALIVGFLGIPGLILLVSLSLYL